MISPLMTVLEKLRTDIPQFISADVVEIDSGMSLCGTASDPKFDGAAASACYAEVIKANGRALDILGIGAGSTEDILVTTEPAYILMRLIGPRHYLGLAIGRAGTLGFARTMMQRVSPVILQAIGS